MEETTTEKKSVDKKFADKKSKKLVREKRLNIRFSDAEFELIEKKAAGMNLARYARTMLTAGYVPRRERDFPTIDPKLMREIASMGKNVNQLIRYVHMEANAKRPINTLSLALAIDRFSDELAQLKQQYQVQVSTNDFDIEQFDKHMDEIIDDIGNEKNNSDRTNFKKPHREIPVEENLDAPKIF